MSTIDKQLTGANLCNLDCKDSNNIIHPETCVDQVVVANDSHTTLSEWFSVGAGEITSESSMINWLNHYYPASSSYILPDASESTKGGIKINSTYFNVSDSVLSLKSVQQDWIASSAFTDTVYIGDISGLFNSDNIEITIPKPTVYLNIIDDTLTARQLLGGVVQNESTINLNTLTNGIISSNVYNTSMKNRFSFTLRGNTLGLYDNVLEEITTTQQLPSYQAGKNVTITNNVISATDTTYESFEGTNAGLVPPATVSDQNKYLKGDGTWYDPKYSSTKLWTSSGLSDHYFRITSNIIGSVSIENPKYIPLFRIHMLNQEGYKASHLFEITSRLDHSYYGKFLLTYYSMSGFHSFLGITNTNTSVLELEAYLDSTTSTITVYRKYTAASFPDTFIVTILGQNNPDYTPPQCEYTYYCTASYDGDIVINQTETPIGDKL